MWLFNHLDPARPRSVVTWALLVGAVAGLVAATFHAVVTEPLIEDAIEIEEARAAATGDLEHPATEPEQVSREDQRGAGLFLGYALLGAAYGLLTAVIALALRGPWLDPLRRVALAATMLAASITVIPWFKYPTNPPGIGDSATADTRQRNYWLLVALLGLVLAGAAHLSRRLRERSWPEARRVAAVVVATALAVGLAVALMPATTDVIPDDIPALLLWRFRVASLTGNTVLWFALALGLALWWSERSAASASEAAGAARAQNAQNPQNSIPFNAEIPES